MPSHVSRTRRSTRHPLSLAVRGIVLSLALPGLALAQETPAGAAPDEPTLLDTMVVTAQKREQQVAEVPIAITAYSGEFLDKLGITGLGQLAGYVPGLQVQEQSPNNPGFVIRGITSDSGDPKEPPRVSVFQDGISISSSRGASVELFDMERVEVLRGPQGTLFGRAAEVGAVHLIQNKARDENSSQLEVGAGAFDQRLVNGYFNASIAPEALFARVAVFHEERDGSIDNAAGGTLNGKDTTAVRTSLGMRMGEMSSLDFILNYQHDTPPGTAFRSSTIPNRQGSTRPYDTAELNRGEQLGLDRKVYGATVLGSFPLDDNWRLNTISGWREFDSHEEFDADGSQVHALEFAEIAEGTQWSHELRFNYDNGGSFAGFFGTSYFNEEGSQMVPFRTDERSLVALLTQDPAIRGLISGLLGGATVPIIPPLNPDGSPNLDYTFLGLQGLFKQNHEEAFANYATTRSWDLFIDGTWHVNERLELSAGLRGTREELTGGFQSFAGNGATLLNGLGTGTPTPLAGSNILNRATNGVVERSGSFDSLVGRLAARYVFSDQLSGYATVSRGRRPNVVDPTPQDGLPDGQTLPAEIVNSYEIGIKGNALSGRLVYDLAGYWYTYTNFQTLQLGTNGIALPANAGNATAKGIEASLSGKLTNALSVFANYAWTHARFDDRDDNGNPQEYAGNSFRLTPDHSAAIGLDWSLPFGAGNQFYLRPSYTWKSRIYFEDENAPGVEQGAYGLLNLRMGVRLDNNRWDIGAWATNLADEEFLIDGGNTGRRFGTPTFVPGSPRMYGVTARVRF